jgi:hypothetical protein
MICPSLIMPNSSAAPNAEKPTPAGASPAVIPQNHPLDSLKTQKLEKWHVRSYRLGLENDLPVFTEPWRDEEEFTINQFVDILCEIPPGGTASKLHTGSGWRKDGPLLAPP